MKFIVTALRTVAAGLVAALVLLFSLFGLVSLAPARASSDTIVVHVPDDGSSRFCSSGLNLRGGSFFELSLTVATEPVGPRLGGFDLPGSLHFYLNMTARLFFVTLLHGHVEFS